MLSNTVIAEAPSSANKETSECSTFNFQPLPEPNVVEKIYTTNCSDEKPQLSSFESSQIEETNVIETEEKVDVNPPESEVIIIQAAIRGLLVCLPFESLLIQNLARRTNRNFFFVCFILVSFRLIENYYSLRK